MGKKLKVCKGKSCKEVGSFKKISEWADELDLNLKIKKTKCLGICKKSYAVEFKGEIYSCPSKDELEELVAKKNKNKKK